MSNSDSTTTPAGANPFGSEIDLGRFENLPLLDCVNDALRKEILNRFRQITAAATESALVEILNLVAGPICAAAYSEQQADTEITTVLVWFARMMEKNGVDGKWVIRNFNDSPDSYGSTSASLELALRERIYASTSFAKYWAARQELATRRAARLRKIEPAEQTLRGIKDKLERLLQAKFPPGEADATSIPAKEPKGTRKKSKGRSIRTTSLRRHRLIDPLLDQKIWTPYHWADAANADRSVAYNYLAGKSYPQKKFANKLARAIGLSELPK